MTGRHAARRKTFIPITTEGAPATAHPVAPVIGSPVGPRDPNARDTGTSGVTSGILVAPPPRTARTHINRMHTPEVTR